MELLNSLSDKDVLEKGSNHFEPVAYAVLSYVVDKKNHLALLKDPHYKKIQLPGRRLLWGEQLHDVALSMASKELDICTDELKHFPVFNKKNYNGTELIPSPFQVQLEKGPHRQTLAHYDFVYVLTIDRDMPRIRVKESEKQKFAPEWYTFEEVESRQEQQWGPHPDMVDTMRLIMEKVGVN